MALHHLALEVPTYMSIDLARLSAFRGTWPPPQTCLVVGCRNHGAILIIGKQAAACYLCVTG